MFSHFSVISRDRQTRLLSKEQSFVRVAAENQHAKIEPFQVWAVDTGLWGGRDSELTPEDPDPSKSLPTVTEVSLQDWMTTSESESFTMQPPDSLHRPVQLRLVQELGQVNVDRLCIVIWSIVGFVCPAWSFGVDKACYSQHFDSLFAYSLLGCFELLSSGRSNFHCSSWGQVEELNVLMLLSICL